MTPRPRNARATSRPAFAGVLAVVLGAAVLVLPASKAGAGRGEPPVPESYRIDASVELSYKDYLANLDDTDLDQRTFEQKYDLGLSGPVVQPRVGLFDARVSVLGDVGEVNDDALDVWNVGYDFWGQFLPKTLVPITMYAIRTNSWVTGGGQPDFRDTTERYGAQGRLAYEDAPAVFLWVDRLDVEHDQPDNRTDMVDHFADLRITRNIHFGEVEFRYLFQDSRERIRGFGRQSNIFQLRDDVDLAPNVEMTLAGDFRTVEDPTAGGAGTGVESLGSLGRVIATPTERTRLDFSYDFGKTGSTQSRSDTHRVFGRGEVALAEGFLLGGDLEYLRAGSGFAGADSALIEAELAGADLEASRRISLFLASAGARGSAGLVHVEPGGDGTLFSHSENLGAGLPLGAWADLSARGHYDQTRDTSSLGIDGQGWGAETSLDVFPLPGLAFTSSASHSDQEERRGENRLRGRFDDLWGRLEWRAGRVGTLWARSELSFFRTNYLIAVAVPGIPGAGAPGEPTSPFTGLDFASGSGRSLAYGGGASLGLMDGLSLIGDGWRRESAFFGTGGEDLRDVEASASLVYNWRQVTISGEFHFLVRETTLQDLHERSFFVRIRRSFAWDMGDRR